MSIDPAAIEARDRFVREYAVNSGVTVEWLMRYQVAIPAHVDPWPCSDEGCKGWHMYGRAMIAEDITALIGRYRAEAQEWLDLPPTKEAP